MICTELVRKNRSAVAQQKTKIRKEIYTVPQGYQSHKHMGQRL